MDKIRGEKKVIEKQMTQKKAASIISLSERQIKRNIKRVRREGMSGIIY